MANNDNLEKGVRFSSTNQPAKRGRRPNTLKKVIDENKLSKDDVKNLFLNILSERMGTLKKRIEKSDKLAPFEAIGIRSVIEDLKKGDMKNINIMLEWCFGKPSQHIDATVTSVTAEDRAALENALRGGDD
jgi:hypothetical protein